MRITFVVDGGLAVFPGLARPHVVDVDASPDAARLRQLVTCSRFFECEAPPAPATRGAADERCHVVTIDDGPRRRTMTVPDGHDDGPLTALVVLLEAQARRDRSGGSKEHLPTEEPDLPDEPAVPSDDAVVAATRAWVRLAVIGLDLCPFAKGPEAKGRVRYVVADARSEESLLAALDAELDHLLAVDERVCETTLLIHPYVLDDFLDYNDFVGVAEERIAERDLDGFVQLATFHPQYRFAGTAADDLGNATNRSPYPTLQLLREASIDRAVAAIPDASTIYEANLATLDALGDAGWAALRRGWAAD